MYVNLSHLLHEILYITPLVLQLIGELISYVCLVCLLVCVVIMFFGENMHILQSSLHTLKPVLLLLGSLFGGRGATSGTASPSAGGSAGAALSAMLGPLMKQFIETEGTENSTEKIAQI